MFFSDHGEEVFQDENFYGHLEDRPTKSTFEIPLLMWFSKNYKYPDDYVLNQNVKYMTDDLWHSIAHISGIKCKFIELERSVFSSNFVVRKRLILKGKDYDTFLK
jgi:heptose-I-phosphate ethanolaminephosphotransferase